MSTRLNKRNIVIEDSLRQRSKKNQRTNKRKNHIHRSEDMVQQQRRKEKELLNQWKAERDETKKNNSIVRNQAQDVSRREKERFNETDYEFCGEPEDRYILKCCPRYREHNSYYA